MERHAPQGYVRPAPENVCHGLALSPGGEVPRLVAVEGDVAADGR